MFARAEYTILILQDPCLFGTHTRVKLAYIPDPCRRGHTQKYIHDTHALYGVFAHKACAEPINTSAYNIIF